MVDNWFLWCVYDGYITVALLVCCTLLSAVRATINIEVIIYLHTRTSMILERSLRNHWVASPHLRWKCVWSVFSYLQVSREGRSLVITDTRCQKLWKSKRRKGESFHRTDDVAPPNCDPWHDSHKMQMIISLVFKPSIVVYYSEDEQVTCELKYLKRYLE
ncbi:hypothetical protein F5Y18DRAFT_45923 [Xylariaceae sp. FL1019]|nr:hypothetical protein F5Y18DRAFT_45923 [Xylariaceae sp. FL1019]